MMHIQPLSHDPRMNCSLYPIGLWTRIMCGTQEDSPTRGREPSPYGFQGLNLRVLAGCEYAETGVEQP